MFFDFGFAQDIFKVYSDSWLAFSGSSCSEGYTVLQVVSIFIARRWKIDNKINFFEVKLCCRQCAFHSPFFFALNVFKDIGMGGFMKSSIEVTTFYTYEEAE